MDYGDAWIDGSDPRRRTDLVRQLIVALIVEPLLREADETYSLAHTARLRLARVNRQIADLKSSLQRTDPVKDPTGHRAQFAHLTELEMRRKALQAVGLG